MPTFHRPAFVRLAVEYFRRQTYPNLELVVVDDGVRSVRQLIPNEPQFRYVKLARRLPLGTKRNVAVQNARGPIVVHWDDDDWYSPDRVALQVSPILQDRADVTGLGMHDVLFVDGMRLLRCSPELHASMHHGPIFPGTLAYRRALWGRVPFRPVRCGEDAIFLRELQAQARVLHLPETHACVVVRHGKNTWKFDVPDEETPPGWSPVVPKDAFAADMPRYSTVAQHRTGSQEPERTFVINLRRNLERRNHMKWELEHHWRRPAEFFEGVDGRTIDMERMRRDALIREQGWMSAPLSPGEIGCWLSHAFVLQTIVEQQIESALILEDDVQIHRDCASLLEARLRELRRVRPHIDIVHLGCYEGYAEWAPAPPQRHLPGGFFRLGHDSKGCPGGYAYMVTHRGATKWLRRLCAGPIDQPIDQVIREQSERSLQVYCASPPLVTVGGRPSVIRSTQTDEAALDPGWLERIRGMLEAHAPRRWWMARRTASDQVGARSGGHVRERLGDPPRALRGRRTKL